MGHSRVTHAVTPRFTHGAPQAPHGRPMELCPMGYPCRLIKKKNIAGHPRNLRACRMRFRTRCWARTLHGGGLHDRSTLEPPHPVQNFGPPHTPTHTCPVDLGWMRSNVGITRRRATNFAVPSISKHCGDITHLNTVIAVSYLIPGIYYTLCVHDHYGRDSCGDGVGHLVGYSGVHGESTFSAPLPAH